MRQVQKLMRHVSDRGVAEACRWAWHSVQVHYTCRRLGFSRPPQVPLSEVGIDDVECHRHGATNYPDFRKSMRAVPLRAGEDVFLDFGSGMGAALVMAAQYPFRRLLGVEISAQLNEQARELLDRLRPRLRCREYELQVANALDYEVPDNVTVVHMFSPFRGKILEAALASIRRSLERRPRRLYLISKNMEHFGEPPAWMREIRRFACYPRHDCVVFRCELSG